MAKKGVVAGIVIAVLVVIVAYGAASYHIIKTEDKTYMVKKESLGFSETYVNTTSWGPMDWVTNGNIRNALVRAKAGEIQGDINKALEGK